MNDNQSPMPSGARPYETRLHRHRRMYWQVILPLAILLVASHYLDRLQEGLLLAILVLLILILKKLTDANDLLGYLGSLQRKNGSDSNE